MRDVDGRSQVDGDLPGQHHLRQPAGGDAGQGVSTDGRPPAPVGPTCGPAAARPANPRPSSSAGPISVTQRQPVGGAAGDAGGDDELAVAVEAEGADGQRAGAGHGERVVAGDVGQDRRRRRPTDTRAATPDVASPNPSANQANPPGPSAASGSTGVARAPTCGCGGRC